MNLVRPGAGVPIRADRRGGRAAHGRAPPLRHDLEHIFPASIIDAMARNDVLQIVVFAFLFGAACAAIGAKAEPVVAFCESLAEVMFRYTQLRHVPGAVRRGRGHGRHRGQQGRRRAVRPGQADR